MERVEHLGERVVFAHIAGEDLRAADESAAVLEFVSAVLANRSNEDDLPIEHAGGDQPSERCVSPNRAMQ